MFLAFFLVCAQQSCRSNVATSLNKSEEEVLNLWNEEGVKTPADFRDRGFVSGIRYIDQVWPLSKGISHRLDRTNAQAESRVHKLCNDNDEKKPNIIVAAFRSLLWWRGNQSTKAPENLLPITIEEADLLDFDLQRDFNLQPRRQLVTLTPMATPFSSDSNSNSTDAGLTITHSADSSSQNITEAALNSTRAPASSSQPSRTSSSSSQSRFLAAGMYLRKMRKGSRILSGLQLKEVFSGPRIAVINAVGSISSGVSSGGGVGSDSLVALLQKVERDRSIKGRNITTISLCIKYGKPNKSNKPWQ